MARCASLEVIRASDSELCQSIAERLSHLSELAPLSCGLPLYDERKPSAVPEWSPLDVKRYSQLLYAADQYRFRIDIKNPTDLERYNRTLAPRIDEAIAQGTAHLQVARAKVYRDGEQVRIIRYSLGCDERDAPGAHDQQVVVFRDREDVPDTRFHPISGDLTYVRGSPYVVRPSRYLSAIGGAAAPPRTHDYYMLVYEMIWAAPGTAAAAPFPGGYAFPQGPRCQVGVNRER